MGPVLETIGNVLIREVSVFRYIDTLILCAIYMLLRHHFCFQNEESLSQMESDIRAAQEAALEAVETDSIMTGTSANPEDSSLFGTTRPLPYYVQFICSNDG